MKDLGLNLNTQNSGDPNSDNSDDDFPCDDILGNGS